MDLSVLRVLRKGKKIKLKELCRAINISSPYLSMIERNIKMPNVDVLEDICSQLDCELRIIPKA